MFFKASAQKKDFRRTRLQRSDGVSLRRRRYARAPFAEPLGHFCPPESNEAENPARPSPRRALGESSPHKQPGADVFIFPNREKTGTQKGSPIRAHEKIK